MDRIRLSYSRCKKRRDSLLDSPANTILQIESPVKPVTVTKDTTPFVNLITPTKHCSSKEAIYTKTKLKPQFVSAHMTPIVIEETPPTVG